ncbi:MAG TPA: AMIN domain-containing protein, partial [Candidatus Angelobacter sp.]|nr:AMIN domain-containing protein [Candidatus Angelobacter sp.]
MKRKAAQQAQLPRTTVEFCSAAWGDNEMRLKQLLGIFLLAIGMSAVAAASDSQLSGVLVKNHENAGTITILANGAFTHSEYRPTDNLMLVDLAGVSVAHPDAKVHPVFAPGVRSYRISTYRAPSGSEVTRIEVSLIPGATVKVNEISGGLELNVTGAPAAPPTKEEIAALAGARTASSLARVRGISVAQSQDAVNIEITGSAPLTGRTMKLGNPERLVLDIPNSVLEGRAREIAVNSNGIKAVRAGRFQAGDTRIVVDLAAMHDFDVVPQGNKLVLRMKTGAAPSHAPSIAEAAAMSASAQSPAAVASTPAVTASEPRLTADDKQTVTPAPGVSLVIVKPEIKKATSTETATAEEKTVEPTPSRAEVAASRFAHEAPTVASENKSPFPASASLAAKPAAINAALMQQQAAATQTPISQSSVSTCTTGRYTGEPIGMNFKDLDLKDFFRVIHEISGLNVVLDPAVKGTVTIVLDDVPWDQALAIVLNNNGLECQLQGNVLRIATLETLKTEAEARRAQQEAQALAVPKETITRYLSYGQARDAVTIVKKFLSPRGDVVADPRSNALIIEDIPSSLAKIDPLLRTLDRKTPEVEIEARVVASTRTFLRDIGTQLGFGFGSGNNAVGGSTADSPIKVT